MNRRYNQPIQLAIDAISRDHVQDLASVIDHTGLSVSATDCSGAPLIFFCTEGRISCLNFLLSRGVNPNQTCPDGTTPVMRASKTCPECLSLLLEYKADLNLRDSWGQNILHHGVFGQTIHARKALELVCRKSSEALFCMPDRRGRIPLIAAVRSDNEHAVTLFSKRTPLLFVDSESNRHALALALELGASLSARVLWPLYQSLVSYDQMKSLIDLALYSCQKYPAVMDHLGQDIHRFERTIINENLTKEYPHHKNETL